MRFLHSFGDRPRRDLRPDPESLPLLPPLPRSPSLQTVLVVSFVFQILVAVGVVGYLSFHSGQKAVNDLVLRLHTVISEQINQQLDIYLSRPNRINRINLKAIELGLLSSENEQPMRQFFWSQMKEYEVSYISFCDVAGRLTGVERLKNDQLVINQVRSTKDGLKLFVYQADASGQPQKLLATKPWDPRSEAWYTETINAKQSIWSSIYQWKSKPEVMSVAMSAPVYDNNHQLLGVISIDLILSEISEFLRRIQIGHSSTVFIVERNGWLVATSSPTPIYQVTQGQVQRIKARESEDAVIHATANELLRNFPTWKMIQHTQQLEFQWKGQRQFAQISPWKDSRGLDWLVVVTTPESEFMDQIQANQQITIFLCGIALIGAIASSIVTARWLTRPILKLSDASHAIAAGDLSQPLQWASSSHEVNTLSLSFESMRQALQSALQQLETYTRSLEEQVAERTAALGQSNDQLQHTLQDLHDAQDHLVQSAKMAVLGQLVASVAHDMNTPLGAIRSSSANLASGLLEAVQELPALLTLLTLDQQQHFATLLRQALTQVPQKLSGRETRQQRRTLEHQLETQAVDNPKAIAELLTELELDPTNPDLASLLQTPHSHRALETLYHFASTQRSLRTIQQAVESASQVVLALRTYAHQDHNRTQVPVNVVDSIETALTLHQNLIRRGVTVERDYAEDLPKVMASPDDLRQVWMNLVHNALQAMNGQGTLKIQVRQRRNKVEVNITDNGSGIDPEVLPKIFEPFFTTKHPGEGSGLGLSIAKKLLEKYQGNISVASSAEETTFTVRLLMYTPDLANELDT